MGRQPCCDKVGLKRGPWTEEEDQRLMSFIIRNGIHCWRLVPKLAGLMRCGKSCRLRWTNYLRPDLKRGALSEEEENQIIELHSRLGNRWSKIASYFPGRTDNEIKNHWNTRIKKRLVQLGIDPVRHQPMPHPSPETAASTAYHVDEGASSRCSGSYGDKPAADGHLEAADGTEAVGEMSAISSPMVDSHNIVRGSASPRVLDNGNGQNDVAVSGCEQITSSCAIDNIAFLDDFDVESAMKLLEDNTALPTTVQSEVILCPSPNVADDFYYSESSSSLDWDDAVVDPGLLSWEGPGDLFQVDDLFSLAGYM